MVGQCGTRHLCSGRLFEDSPEEVAKCRERLITNLAVKTKTAVDQLPDVNWEATSHIDVVLKRQA